MPVFQYENCESTSGWSQNDIIGSHAWNVVSNAFKVNNGSAGSRTCGSLYKTLSGAGITGNLSAVFRVKDHTTIFNGVGEYLAFFSDGTKYFGFGIRRSGQNFDCDPVMRYGTSADLTLNGTISLGNTNSNCEENWIWFRVDYDGLTWSLYYADTDNYPTSWTLSHTVDYALGANITVYGFYGSVQSQVRYTSFDELYITEFGDTVEGFDASINFSSYDWRVAMAGGDNAHMFIKNPFTSVAMSTMEDQGKRAISLYNKLGYPCFRGEVSLLEATRDSVFYTVEEILRKLLYTLVNESPIIVQTYISNILQIYIYTQTSGFLNNGVTTSHLANLVKSAPKTVRKNIYDTSITESDFTTAYVPDNTEGSYPKTWFDNVALPDADNDYALTDDPGTAQNTTERFVLICNFVIPINQATALDNMSMELTMAGLSPDVYSASGGSHDYELYAYNYSTTTWKKFKQIRKSDLSGKVSGTFGTPAPKRSNPLVIIQDIESGIIESDGTSEYSSTGAYNTGDNIYFNNRLWTALQTFDQTVIGAQYPVDGSAYWDLTIREFLSTPTVSGVFDNHTVKIGIKTAVFRASDTASSWRNALWVFRALLEANMVGNNSPTDSTSAIAVVNEDFIGLTNAITNFPEVQGYGVDDIVVVSKKASDYLDDAFGNSSLSSYMTLDYSLCTGITTLGVIEDYTNRPFSDLFEYIESSLNAIHCYDYVSDTLLLISAGNHVSSSVTFTEADILGFNDNMWSYSIDYSLERTKLRVIGDNGIQPDDASITPTHAFGLGDEWEVIEDLDIKTDGQAADIISTRSTILPKPKIMVKFKVDFSKPAQANYAQLRVGKTAAVVITNVCDYSSGGTDGEELVIMAMEGKVGPEDHEIVELTLEARYS